MAGLVFRAPVVAETVYTLGYPKIPYTDGAPLTMQPGAVTNEMVVSLEGNELFLYSAIARPGNSGGPVMSEDGYVVGISSVDLTLSEPFSPHYAGVPAQRIVSAVREMGMDIEISFDALE